MNRTLNTILAPLKSVVSGFSALSGRMTLPRLSKPAWLKQKANPDMPPASPENSPPFWAGLQGKIRMNLQAKIGAAMGVILVMMGVVGWMGVSGANRIMTIQRETSLNQTASILMLKTVQSKMYQLQSIARQEVLVSSNQAEVDKLIDENNQVDKEIRDNLDAFSKLNQTAAVQEKFTQVKDSYSLYMLKVSMIYAYARSGDLQVGIEQILSAEPAAQKLNTALNSLIQADEEAANAGLVESEANLQSSQIFIIGITVLAVLIGVIISIFLSRSLSNAARLMARTAGQISSVDLAALVAATAAVAEGDLTADVSIQTTPVVYQSADELGELAVAFNQMVAQLQEIGVSFSAMLKNLRGLIGEVNANANELRAASGQLAMAATQTEAAINQISATIQQLARGTSQQSETIGRTAESITQMSRAIDGVARGAQEQAAAVGRAADSTGKMTTALDQVSGSANAGVESAKDAARVAQTGAAVVAETIQGMEKIKQTVGQTSRKVRGDGRPL